MTQPPAATHKEAVELAVFDTGKKLVSELFGTCAGKVFAVLGGGTSLPDDIKKLPKGCVLIGVNQHAASAMPVDYIVSLDDNIPRQCRAVSDAPIISALQDDAFVTHLIVGDEVENMKASFQSAIPAMMLAIKMGAKQVRLCGFDLYTDGDKYFTGLEAVKQPELSLMLDFWKGAAQALGSEAKKIKVSAASLLATIFDSYK